MTSDILIHGKFSIARISTLLNQKLRGQQISENVQVGSVELKADDDWLYTIMTVFGRHNGTLVAKYKLQTRSTGPDLFIDQLEISLESGSLLATAANWILRNILGDKIETKVQGILHKTMSTMMLEMMAKYSKLDFDGVTIKSELENYNFVEISWDSRYVRCTFHASGVLRVELE